MDNEINKKYFKKIDEINKQYLYINDHISGSIEDKECCKENDVYHQEFDDLLLELITELGYKDIVKKYEKAQQHFWYA